MVEAEEELAHLEMVRAKLAEAQEDAATALDAIELAIRNFREKRLPTG